MKIKDSTFFGLLFAGIFLIVVFHVSLKNLLHETVFRSSNNTVKSVGIVNPDQNKVTGIQTPLSDSKQELMDYIKSNIKQIAATNGTLSGNIKPANHFSGYHQSNIFNEETDLSKYFQISQPAPYIANSAKLVDGVSKAVNITQTDSLSGNPSHFEYSSNGSLTYKPDIWTYPNENPMNGGLFEGIRGQDQQQSDFATYAPANQIGSIAPYQTSYPYIQSHADY